MRTIRELLEQKGVQVWTITPEASVYDALALMAEHNIGALLVMDEGRLLGLIAERDYARNVVLRGRLSKSTRVSEIMDPRPVCTTPNDAIEAAMALMTEKRVRHLPVVENGEVVGLVSIGDLVKAIISEQKFLIEQLEHYITG